MEILFEIFIRGLVIGFLGVNTRYYFFRIFNKNVKKKDFETDQEDIGASFSQGFYNFFIGLFVFSILAYGIVSILYVFDLL
ncbi:hypothetical protein SAMN05421841_2687 [Chryseobacterium wanjuense]|uniref:Uncharacterized protein n=1 Tax=Chryseobacterium wanjuense TaxID=356305 RepID=A0A1I0RJ30_9FLAO|nr:hypothetical protein [Chryseobacterium wanjuense]SEW40274.1 hypothetical protein SAMN05421841_2687 [Chryseobacterium wanjuense]